MTKPTLLALMMLLLVAQTTALVTDAATPSDRVKHIVVLMLENRAFDHVFGWFPGVDGLNGSQFNRVNASDPNSTKVFQTPNSTYINQCDPNHGLPATTYKIFGPQAVKSKNFSNPTMDGFVDFERNVDRNGLNENYCNVMESFTPDKLPVINTLAAEYVLMDRFFAALPGPTWPNRLFFMAGTSSGLTETFPWYHNSVGTLFPTRTIFDQVEEAGGSWRVYYNDTPWELFVGSLAHHTEHIHSLGQFFDDCRRGSLPDFAYINPRSGINMTEGVGSNDEHPDHDMAVGERYIKDIYEAIRASPQWNETLFVLTFDEHGGFYDHVVPPMNVPPPDDGEESYPDKDFKFDRLGIRIPTILVSPWVPKGLILNRAPPAQKPAHNSEYDLTSIIASARKILGVLNATKALTKRDAWSSTFEHVLMQTNTIRQDCPLHMPEPPKPSLGLQEEGSQVVNSLQDHIMTVHAGLLGRSRPPHIRAQRDVSPWLQKKYLKHHALTQRWKQSKRENFGALARHIVIVQPVFNTSFEAEHWKINTMANQSGIGMFPMTISIVVANETLCLDSGLGVAGVHAAVTRCYPSDNPATNRDRAQLWVLENDASIRPFHNQTICLTNRYFTGDDSLHLEQCITGKVEQRWAWHGQAPGQPYVGAIFFSDWTTALKVAKRA